MRSACCSRVSGRRRSRGRRRRSLGTRLRSTSTVSASDLNQLDVRGTFTWGVQAARLFTTHWGAEVLWTQQKSALEGGTASSGAFDFFTMTVRQLQGNVLYEFGAGEAKVRPFVFGGIGATFFSAADLQSETKLSFDYGGGPQLLRVAGHRHACARPFQADGTPRQIGR